MADNQSFLRHDEVCLRNTGQRSVSVTKTCVKRVQVCVGIIVGQVKCSALTRSLQAGYPLAWTEALMNGSPYLTCLGSSLSG